MIGPRPQFTQTPPYRRRALRTTPFHSVRCDLARMARSFIAPRVDSQPYDVPRLHSRGHVTVIQNFGRGPLIAVVRGAGLPWAGERRGASTCAGALG